MTDVYCSIKECYNNMFRRNKELKCRLESIRIDCDYEEEYIKNMKAECASFDISRKLLKKGE